MSIQLVNLRAVAKDANVARAIHISLNEFDKHPTAFYLKGFVGATLLALRDFVKDKKLDFGVQVNKLLTERVQDNNLIALENETPSADVLFGRLGLRPITSPYAKQSFPEASHELVLTLLNTLDDSVHIFLVYL